MKKVKMQKSKKAKKQKRKKAKKQKEIFFSTGNRTLISRDR